MAINLLDISTIFNHLRDGVITSIKYESRTLSLELYIPHLARYHNEEETKFYISLFSVSEAYLIPWGKKDAKITDIKGLASNKLRILSADLNPFNFIEVQTEADQPDKYVGDGGMFFLKAKSCTLYDEQFNRISMDEIMSISQRYWKDRKTMS